MSLLLAATGDESLLATIGSYAWMILSVGAGLGFVIFVHELGHFLVAKACGVKCDKFYIGFDVPMPKVFGWQIPSKLVHFQWGETEYGVGILPLGGYVKMLGQDDDPRNAESEAERTRVASEAGQVQLDPRSFPAKSVPARMAIISAGVIMNLIFAVILAAIAYRFGVPEMPAVIGGTMPASPAWTANIEPGSKVLQFGRSGSEYEYLRWEDLMREVVLNGSDRNLPMLVRGTDGEKEWFDLRPSDRLKTVSKRPTLGVTPQRTREIRMLPKTPSHLVPSSDVPLVDKDVIVAVGDRRLESDFQLTELLAIQPKGSLKITVARTEKADEAAEKEKAKVKEIDIVVQPKPMRELGLIMKIGPVVAVRNNSPADDEDFQIGDVITQINGQPVGDPLSLGQRWVPKPGENGPIEFVVSRTRNGKATTKTISVVPELPRQFQNEFSAGGPTSIESIGIAFDVTPVVEEVVAGGPADKAGLKPGDVISEALFVAASPEAQAKEVEVAGDKGFQPIVVDTVSKTWTYIAFRMQLADPSTRVKLTWIRDGKPMSETLQPIDSTAHFDEERGMFFAGTRRIHKADDWSSAFALGFRETTERIKEVLRVLLNLVTFHLPASNLSGPFGIIYAAGSFASEGVPMLLIFLTLLSANLAVLNFLPIPALDGGHMLFLTAEWIRGKPVDERLQIRLTIAGILCLLSLMVFATAMDIGRFLG